MFYYYLTYKELKPNREELNGGSFHFYYLTYKELKLW